MIDSSGTDISVSYMLRKGAVKYAVGSDNYLDISVVASYPRMFKTYTLSIDYVNLVAEMIGYSLDAGLAQTKYPIDPINMSNVSSFSWGLLQWDDNQTEKTEVKYQVLYVNETGQSVLVEDSALPGNEQGFTVSPVSLYALSNATYQGKYNKLKIRATLRTTSPVITPRIFSWSMTWQNGG